MHTYFRVLERVASRYAPSRVLSFDVAHVFTALQMLENDGRTSRSELCSRLVLGEGTVKTLVKHLKAQGLVKTSNGGTMLTTKGKSICKELLSTITAEMSLPKCSIALSRFNYAVLVREFSFAVRLGIEQRDAAIKMGATGATTLLFKENKFVMPASSNDSLKKERQVRKMLVEKLNPKEGDAIIIGSADRNEKTAELAAKNAALVTIFSHEKHQRH
jgi:DNA-binding MarR family transcriptional regulator